MLNNGVRETTATAGTGTVTLTAVTGFARFSDGFSNGSSASYAISDGNNWEWGVGTVGAGNTLARTTITGSLVAGTFTTGGTAITLSGSAVVFIADHTGTTRPASAIVNLSGTNTGDQTITLTGGVTGAGTGSFAATVITNANLTGVITSSGNATSIASQTGTGTKFVVDTSPTIAGVLSIADGTAAAPSLKFDAGGTQLGLYTVASNDYIGVASRGLRAVEIGGFDSGGQHGDIVIYSNSSASFGGNLEFTSSRGTAASPEIIQDGDDIGDIYFNAYDGAYYNACANISATIDGTPGAFDLPGALNFYTTQDGSAAMTLRMKIGNAGIVTMSAYGAGVAKFDSAGVISSGTVTESLGGTNQTTYTTGDILYASAANTLSKLPAGTVNYVLTSGGAGVAPSWAASAGAASATGFEQSFLLMGA